MSTKRTKFLQTPEKSVKQPLSQKKHKVPKIAFNTVSGETIKSLFGVSPSNIQEQIVNFEELVSSDMVFNGKLEVLYNNVYAAMIDLGGMLGTDFRVLNEKAIEQVMSHIMVMVHTDAKYKNERTLTANYVNLSLSGRNELVYSGIDSIRNDEEESKVPHKSTELFPINYIIELKGPNNRIVTAKNQILSYMYSAVSHNLKLYGPNYCGKSVFGLLFNGIDHILYRCDVGQNKKLKVYLMSQDLQSEHSILTSRVVQRQITSILLYMHNYSAETNNELEGKLITEGNSKYIEEYIQSVKLQDENNALRSKIEEVETENEAVKNENEAVLSKYEALKQYMMENNIEPPEGIDL